MAGFTLSGMLGDERPHHSFETLDLGVEERITFFKLSQTLHSIVSQRRYSTLCAIPALLRSRDRVVRAQGDGVFISEIRHLLGSLLVPSQEVGAGGENPIVFPPDIPSNVVEDALSILTTLCTQYSATVDPATLVAVAAYAGNVEGSVSRPAEVTAEQLLDSQLHSPEQKADFITSVISQGFLGPIFAKASSGTTWRGRKRRWEATVDYATDTKRDPWMEFGAEYCISIFTWAVAHSDAVLLGQHWPMYIPFLLALLDDAEVKHKAHGLAATRMFLGKCPPAILRNQGVGEILSQAIQPTLAFLPPLIPPDESARLLDLAYSAILQLAQIDWQPDVNARNRFLVKLLRDEFFAGYQHASQYHEVTEVLTRHSATIVEELGLAASPHLKDLLSIYSAILTDPFAARFPSCLFATVKALQVTLRNCWPRLSHGGYEDQVIMALAVCWLSVHDEQETTKEQPRPDQELLDEIMLTTRILSTVMKTSGNDLASKIGRVRGNSPALDRLFPEKRIA